MLVIFALNNYHHQTFSATIHQFCFKNIDILIGSMSLNFLANVLLLNALYLFRCMNFAGSPYFHPICILVCSCNKLQQVGCREQKLHSKGFRMQVSCSMENCCYCLATADRKHSIFLN